MIDKILSNMKDYHLPICAGVFLIGSVLQWFHHMDASFVAFTATVLGALTGHAFSPAQAQPDPVSTVNVQVQNGQNAQQ